MKKHRNVSLIIIVSIILIPIMANAAGFSLSSKTKKSIGGKVTKVGQSAEIVCSAASGPIFMRPFNTAIPGPFFIRDSTNGSPRVGGYLLGNYQITPDLGTCYNPETGVPIPAFEIKPYGVSR